MPFFKNSTRKKRPDLFKKLAYQIDANYQELDEYKQMSLLSDFALFRQGGRKKVYNLVTKSDPDYQLNIFDYYYTISTGNSAHRIKTTVFFINSKKIALPEFGMKPEGFFHKVGQWLGKEDIDFEQYPKFSNQYWLKGEDEDYIRRTFNKHLLQFFSLEKGWYMEGIGYYMILYKKKKLLSATELAEAYNRGMYIYENMISSKMI